jgi:hypothetical protein
MGSHVGARTWSARRAAVLVVLLFAAVLSRPASGQEHEEHGSDGILPPGDWTEEQEHELLELVAATEEALPQFADVDALPALGFHDFGATAPGGYDHWMNIGWIDDEHILDPNYPESLVFQSTWNEATQTMDHELVAAMFFLPSGYDGSNIPEDLAWMPGWHTHPEVCVTDDYRFAGLANADDSCSSGHPFLGPPMFHVWIVDGECPHRFGEIGVFGVECDLDHGHDPDPHEPGPDPHEPDPHEPGPHDGGDPGHDSTTTTTGHGSSGHGTTAPAARPISRQPNYAG